MKTLARSVIDEPYGSIDVFLEFFPDRRAFRKEPPKKAI